MTDATNLEISLRTRGVDTFQIELRIDDPESEAERRVAGREPIRLDRAQLLKLEIDPAAYGVALGRILFAEQELRDTLNETLAVTQAQETPLHLRLSIGPTAIDLHNIRWETLRLRADEPLLMGENMRFSRHLSSLDWRPVHMRPKGDLRALIAIANPADVEAYSLARVDVPGELARIEAALAEMDRSVLASAASDDDSTPATDAVTLGNIAAHLRDGYDILYLVAHGKLVKGEPYLWLQNPDGTTNRIAGRELVERLRELDHRPTLVVLASCQSAGDGEQPTAHDDGALAALGPRLAQAGIPVVVAMQGNVSMETVAHFMPKFFTELGRDGQIDRAIAVARGAVRKRSDWWMPVLFTRLKRGRIWYTPGFGGEKKGLAEWPSLEIAVEYQKCTPILGPGLTEPLFGSLTEMAARWASSYGFPMDPHHREELPQVAQYLTVQQGEFFVLRELGEHVRAELWQRFGDVLDPELEHAKLDDLMTAVGASLRSDIAPSPYQILAGLDLPIYITTNLNNLLADALRAEGKDPKVEICRWNEDLEELPSVFDKASDEAEFDEERGDADVDKASRENDYRPSPQQPLVYHLFGRIGEPNSLVLTEDDYFDFLIGVTSNKDLIPPVVRRALTDSALLFLGFNIGEWDFRVLFRSIMNREGQGRRKKHIHIAAQIDPEACSFLEPAGARRYLESYFGDANISIFWGGVEDFARELRSRTK